MGTPCYRDCERLVGCHWVDENGTSFWSWLLTRVSLEKILNPKMEERRRSGKRLLLRLCTKSCFSWFRRGRFLCTSFSDWSNITRCCQIGDFQGFYNLGDVQFSIKFCSFQNRIMTCRTLIRATSIGYRRGLNVPIRYVAHISDKIRDTISTTLILRELRKQISKDLSIVVRKYSLIKILLKLVPLLQLHTELNSERSYFFSSY